MGEILCEAERKEKCYNQNEKVNKRCNHVDVKDGITILM